MKRKLHRLLFFLIPLLVVVGIKFTHLRQPTKTQAQPIKVKFDNKEIKETKREKLFTLPSDKWLSFRVPATAKSVRIISRANYSLAPGIEPVDYQVFYRIEPLIGKAHSEGSFTYHKKYTQSVDQKGQSEKAEFYPERRNLYPLPAGTSQIDLQSGATQVLKIRAGHLDENLDSVSAKVSFRQQPSKRKLAYFWERTQEQKREELAKANIHGAAGLSDQERRSLFTNRWTPLGPQGVASKDFEEVFLYTRTDLQKSFIPEYSSKALDPDSIVTGPDLNAVIPIVEPGQYHLKFTAIEPASLFRLVHFNFFGQTIHQRDNYDRILNESGRVTLDLLPGLLEIDTETEFTLELFKGDQKVAHEPTMLRAWMTGSEPITIPVERDSVLKLVGRRFNPSATQLMIRWSGKTKHDIQSVQLLDEPSRYDRAIKGAESYRLYERNEYVLSAPSWAEKVEITSDHAALVNFYARPKSLVHRTRVPSDYQRLLPDPQRQPIWFGTRPMDYERRVQDYQSVLLVIQPIPPEDNQDILAGVYHWEDYPPQQSSNGIYLLEPRDLNVPLGPSALPIGFLQIPTNQNTSLSLQSFPGVHLPNRKLAYHKPTTQPTSLKVICDGTQITQTLQLLAERGEILLPPIPPNTKSISIEADQPIETYLNYVNLDQVTHRKRFAQKVRSNQTYRFNVTKRTQETEVCTARWYAPISYQGTTVPVTVSIASNSESIVRLARDGFTPFERVYLLEQPDTIRESISLFPTPEPIGLWQKFFIPLGNDLPPGDYQIQIKFDDAPTGYFILSKITGGTFPQARFTREAIR